MVSPNKDFSPDMVSGLEAFLFREMAQFPLLVPSLAIEQELTEALTIRVLGHQQNTLIQKPPPYLVSRYGVTILLHGALFHPNHIGLCWEGSHNRRLWHRRN
jgi:hypothetical protein